MYSYSVSRCVYSFCMSHCIPQYWLCSDQHGPQKLNLRSKDALQIQVRIVFLIVMELLVWFVVNGCDICIKGKYQFLRLMTILCPRLSSRIFTLLTMYQQPPLNFSYSYHSGHD